MSEFYIPTFPDPPPIDDREDAFRSIKETIDALRAAELAVDAANAALDAASDAANARLAELSQRQAEFDRACARIRGIRIPGTGKNPAS